MTSEDGRRQYPDDAFLSALEAEGESTTAEVASAVGCSRRGADHRLRDLRDRGKVASRKVGGSLLWSLEGH